MSRPNKKGLDYFPLDVDFFSDDKVRLVSAVHGEIGELIAIKLLCKIYRQEGYFLKWDEDTNLLFASECGRSVEPAHLNEVVKFLVQRNFFDTIQFAKNKVLTSRAIQRRYTKICTDSKRKNWAINPLFEVTDGVTQEKSELTPELTELTHVETTQSKVKESKVKETKEEALTVPTSSHEPKTYKQRRQAFINRIAENAKSYEKKMLNDFFSYWSEKSDNGLKMRFEKQTVFDVSRRLKTWSQKELTTFNANGKPQPVEVKNVTTKPL